jgi:hypothetical protein
MENRKANDVSGSWFSKQETCPLFLFSVGFSESKMLASLGIMLLPKARLLFMLCMAS